MVTVPVPAGLRYVVNRHRATTLHFDLRLEVDGTLASWAVPKGPSLDPGVKRLAIQVDDHDLAEHLAYEDDHKVVWDTGRFEPATDPAPSLAAGHLRFALDGVKLHGGFALTRTRLGWLLSKLADGHAVPGHVWTSADHGSVLSDRRLAADT
nr:DNA polymerase ligase N-terminal domain-containing protein [Nocardioides flavescens]